MAMTKLYGNFTHASCKKMCATAVDQLTVRMNSKGVEKMPKDQIELLDKLLKSMASQKTQK